MKTKLIGYKAWEIEDYLQSFKSSTGKPIFFNMFDENKSAHTDSYGTCLNTKGFLEAYDNATDQKLFTPHEWLDSCQYWLDGNCGTPLKIIATFLNQEIKPE